MHVWVCVSRCLGLKCDADHSGCPLRVLPLRPGSYSEICRLCLVCFHTQPEIRQLLFCRKKKYIYIYIFITVLTVQVPIYKCLYMNVSKEVWNGKKLNYILQTICFCFWVRLLVGWFVTRITKYLVAYTVKVAGIYEWVQSDADPHKNLDLADLKHLEKNKNK